MTNLKAKSQLYPQLLDVLKSVKDTNLKTSQKYVHSPFYGKIKGGILQLRCHNVWLPKDTHNKIVKKL